MLYHPRDKGQGLVEYAFILVFVAVMMVIVMSLIGPALGNVFSSILIGL